MRSPAYSTVRFAPTEARQLDTTRDDTNCRPPRRANFFFWAYCTYFRLSVFNKTGRRSQSTRMRALFPRENNPKPHGFYQVLERPVQPRIKRSLSTTLKPSCKLRRLAYLAISERIKLIVTYYLFTASHEQSNNNK